MSMRLSRLGKASILGLVHQALRPEGALLGRWTCCGRTWRRWQTALRAAHFNLRISGAIDPPDHETRIWLSLTGEPLVLPDLLPTSTPPLGDTDDHAQL